MQGQLQNQIFLSTAEEFIAPPSGNEDWRFTNEAVVTSEDWRFTAEAVMTSSDWGSLV